jgi:hypothetical protein
MIRARLPGWAGSLAANCGVSIPPKVPQAEAMKNKKKKKKKKCTIIAKQHTARGASNGRQSRNNNAADHTL